MKDDVRDVRSLHAIRYSGGWTLMGALLGGAVISIIAIVGAVLYNDYKQDQRAQGRARQLGAALEQLEAYGRKYHGALSAGSGIAGVAVASAPTTGELRALGFAAQSFADDSQPGGALVFRIEREPAGCATAKCVLHLTTITSGSVRTAGKVDEPLAQLTAGYVAHGAGWSNEPGKAHNLIKNGNALPNPLGSIPAVVAAKLWLGNNQSSQTVPPPSYSYRDVACQSGYSGQIEQMRTTITDKWGNTSTGSWETVGGQCTKDEPPPETTAPPASTPATPDPLPAAPPVTPTPPPSIPTPPPVCCSPPPPDPEPEPEPELPAPVACIPGYGSTSRGQPGYCNDCDRIAWVETSFGANKTAAQRQCFTMYGEGY